MPTQMTPRCTACEREDANATPVGHGGWVLCSPCASTLYYGRSPLHGAHRAGTGHETREADAAPPPGGDWAPWSELADALRANRALECEVARLQRLLTAQTGARLGKLGDLAGPPPLPARALRGGNGIPR